MRDGYRDEVQAVLWLGADGVRVDDVPEPVLRAPGDAIVRVRASAIGAADLHVVTGGDRSLPVGTVLGREAVGAVVDVGDEVVGLIPGDRVVVPSVVACGRCAACRRGRRAHCEATDVEVRGSALGHPPLGTHAELVRVPHASATLLPAPRTRGVADEPLVLLADVLPAAWRAVEEAAPPDGGTLVVLGLGPVGLLCVTLARARGVARVLGIDTVAARMAAGRARGAEVLDASLSPDVASEVRARTSGRGADVVIHTDGHGAGAPAGPGVVERLVARLPDVLTGPSPSPSSPLGDAVGAVRPGGTVVVVGAHAGTRDAVPLGELYANGVVVRCTPPHGPQGVPGILDSFVRDDPLALAALVTHGLPLRDAPDAFRLALDGGALEVVLLP